MKKSRALFAKHEELIRYLFFGIITTVASLAACFLTLKFGILIWHDESGEPTEFLDVLGSTVQWVVGVIVAFVTNKKWVFKGAEHGIKKTAIQFFTFSGSRVFTYFLEVAINLSAIAALEACGYKPFILNLLLVSFPITERIWAKLISSVVVVISNYFISKLIVFKKKTTDKADET